MTFAVKQDETTDPIDVRLFSANAVMLTPKMPSDAVEQPRRRSDCGRGGEHREHNDKSRPGWQGKAISDL